MAGCSGLFGFHWLPELFVQGDFFACLRMLPVCAKCPVACRNLKMVLIAFICGCHVCATLSLSLCIRASYC